MMISVSNLLLPILIIWSTVHRYDATCTSATIGQQKCINYARYNGYQWATCVSKEYLDQKSQGLGPLFLWNKQLTLTMSYMRSKFTL